MKRSVPAPRRGAVLIAVLVCLAIVMMLMLGAVQISVRQQRQVRQHLQLEQTRWLLDAGISRAISQLQSQPEYRGETLSVTSGRMKELPATVEIAITATEKVDQFRLRVTARTDRVEETNPSMQRSLERLLTLPSK